MRRRLTLAALPVLMAPGSGSTAAAQPEGAAPQDPVRRGRALQFSRDHGAHLANRIEWWYLTAWLGTPEQPALGVQITFFRLRTGWTEGTGPAVPGRFAPRHLLPGRHRHAQRAMRWNGDPNAAAAAAALHDTRVHIGNWWLQRDVDRLSAEFDLDERRRLQLTLTPTQGLLLQGDQGFSRKGPLESQASHYYSQPQLAVEARWRGESNSSSLGGRAWLDHEWSDDLLHPDAVGWDWLGINLFDGSTLTAFRLRRADGSGLWAGGSWRPPDGRLQVFEPYEVTWVPGRRWTSPTSQAAYPVEWSVQTAAGRFRLRALLDAQELDGRAGTGLVYWEGLSELLDAQGRRVGLGYLEMTGYAGRLVLG